MEAVMTPTLVQGNQSMLEQSYWEHYHSADVLIKVGTDQYRCHKVVLSEGMTKMKMLLEDIVCSPGYPCKMDCSGYDQFNFRYIIEFIYSGANIPVSSLNNFKEDADDLGVKGLHYSTVYTTGTAKE